MSIDGSDAARVNRVLTTTLDRYLGSKKGISNELKRNDGIIAVFGDRKRIEVVTGQRAIETLDVSENSTFAARSHLQDVPTALQDSRREAKYAWATVDGSVTVNDIEQAMNAGPEQIFPLMDAEVQNAKNTIIRIIADQLRKASPTSLDPESIRTLIEDNAGGSQTNSPGGISRATNPFWRNQYDNTSMDISSNSGYGSLLAFMMQDVAKGSGLMDKPDFGLTTGTLFADLGSGNGDANRRFSDERTLKLGFSNIVVDTATIISDPNMPTGDLFLINTNFMGIKVLKTKHMKEAVGETPQTMPVSLRPFMIDPKSWHSIGLMAITYAFTLKSGQRQGIATNLS